MMYFVISFDEYIVRGYNLPMMLMTTYFSSSNVSHKIRLVSSMNLPVLTEETPSIVSSLFVRLLGFPGYCGDVNVKVSLGVAR